MTRYPERSRTYRTSQRRAMAGMSISPERQRRTVRSSRTIRSSANARSDMPESAMARSKRSSTSEHAERLPRRLQRVRPHLPHTRPVEAHQEPPIPRVDMPNARRVAPHHMQIRHDRLRVRDAGNMGAYAQQHNPNDTRIVRGAA